MIPLRYFSYFGMKITMVHVIYAHITKCQVTELLAWAKGLTAASVDFYVFLEQ